MPWKDARDPPSLVLVPACLLVRVCTDLEQGVDRAKAPHSFFFFFFSLTSCSPDEFPCMVHCLNIRATLEEGVRVTRQKMRGEEEKDGAILF